MEPLQGLFNLAGHRASRVDLLAINCAVPRRSVVVIPTRNVGLSSGLDEVVADVGWVRVAHAGQLIEGAKASGTCGGGNQQRLITLLQPVDSRSLLPLV